MSSAAKFVQWFFVGCLCVLVILHAANFATAVQAVGGQVTGAGKILTGAGG